MKSHKNYSLEIILVFIFILIDISIVFAMQQKITYIKNRNNRIISRQNDTIARDNQEPVSNEDTTSDNQYHSNDDTNYDTNEPEIKTTQDTAPKKKTKPKKKKKSKSDINHIITEDMKRYYKNNRSFNYYFVEEYILNRELSELDPKDFFINNQEKFDKLYLGNFHFGLKDYEDLIKIQIVLNTVCSKNKKGHKYDCDFSNDIWDEFFAQFSWFKKRTNKGPKNDEQLKKEFGKNSFEYQLCKTLTDYRETYFK